MIIEKGDDNKLQIVEEFIESKANSLCANVPKNDLALVLQGSVKMLNKQLPIMIDGDTQLEKSSSEGNTLVYHYVLINYLSTEIDPEALEQNLRAIVTQQSCTLPSIKRVVDRGGSISHRYNGKDQKQILAFNVDKASCP